MGWMGLEAWLGWMGEGVRSRSRGRRRANGTWLLNLERLEDRLTPATVIDDFSINGGAITAVGPAPPTVQTFGATSGPTANILGGFRQATVQALSAAATREATFDTAVPGLASLSTAASVNGALRLVYDGLGTDGAMNVTPGGLGGINLADDAISFNIVGNSDLGVRIDITVYSGPSFTPSTLTRNMPGDPTGTNPSTLNYPFAAFAGANFAQVGAIVIDVLPLPNTLSADTSLELFTSAGTPTADLSITKTNGTTSYTPGTQTTYTVTATNNGPDPIFGAAIVDNLPAGITSANWTAVYSSGSSGTTSGSGDININDVNLLSGGTATFTIVADIGAGTTGTLSNTATITAPAGTTDPTPGNNSATDSDGQATDLQITKTDGAGVTTYTPGGTVTYTIVVTNAGSSTVNGATVADTLPAALSGANWTVNYSAGSSGAVANGGTGTGNINTTVNLLPNGTATFVVTANIAASATGNLVNTATVAAPTGFTDTNTANNSATDTDTRLGNVNLSVTKTDGAGVTTYVPGGTTTYTIVVTNTGISNVTGVTVSDPIPTGVTSMSWTANYSAGASGTTSGSGAINISNVNLAVNATATFTVIANISAAATGNLVNTVTATVPSGNTDPDTNNNTATDTNTPAPQANLAITKTDGAGVTTYTPGGSTTYTIVVTNNGPSNVTGATVVDNFPAEITSASWTVNYSAGSSGAIANGGTGTGNINTTVNLLNGGTATFVVTAQISAAASGDLVNTATVTAPGGTTDPNTANNSATDTDTNAPSANLAITKNDGVTTYTPGGTTTYTIVVTNNGPSAVTGATVLDTLPAGIASASWTVNYSAGSSGAIANGGTGTGNINTTVNLLNGGTATFVVTANISAAATGNLANTATVTAPVGTTDSTPGNNSATDTDTQSADLQITKTNGAGVTTYTPGALVTYTIVVTNASAGTVNGATVADTMPGILSNVSWVVNYSAGSSGAIANGAGGTGNINTTVNLLSNGTATFTVTGTASAAATTNLVNTATVTAPAGVTDPTPGNNSATDTDTPAPQANLSVTKNDNSPTYTPGTQTTYTIVVTNLGPSNVTGVTVTDTLPAAITSATWSAVYVNGSGTTTGTGNININNVALQSGGTATFTIIANISAAATGDLVNTASAAVPAGTTDPTPGNNSATDTDTPATGNITGIVYIDVNGNGIYNAGTDTPIQGVTMTLSGAATGTAVTNASGVYTFANLLPGSNYTVTEQAQNTVPLAGLFDGQETRDNVTPLAGSITTDTIGTITVVSGQTTANQNFGELQPASLGGVVYIDVNNNGVYNVGVDTPLQGVVVSLGGTSDLGPVPPAADITDANGVYTFTGLRPSAGSGYNVTEQPQSSAPLTGLLDNYETSGNVTPLAGSTATDAITNIELAAGQNLLNQNFGELQPSSLTGVVYIDFNTNGVFDSAIDTPISGATVILSGANDLGAITPISVTTDAAGVYLFNNLRPSGTGGYTITEPQPTGFNDATDSIGTVSGTPSGTQSATGNPDVIGGIVLGVNQAGINYNFGEFGNPIMGQAFVDTNKNGARDANEAPLPGVVVVLKNQTGTILASTTTDATGTYAFTNLPPATYTIEEVQPLGYGSSSPDRITATLGTSGLADLDFADTLGCIQGFVFVDINNNRVKDVGEPGITGATVTLTGTDVNGRPASQTVNTLPGGAYSFTGLVAGTYSVSEPLPAGFLDGLDAIGTINGVAVGTQGAIGNPDTIGSIVLPAGQVGTNYNFGERSPTGTVVAGRVFYDQNRNGVNDATETGIGGVNLELRSATTGALLQTTLTAADGSYYFLGVPTGTVRILEVQPRGYGSSTANMLTVTVPAAGLSNQNFGDTLGSLGGFAYTDLNSNGTKDAGETGIAGVTFTLMGIDANFQPVSRTTVTGADGSYLFADLLDDSGNGYTITETQPAGLTDGLDTRGTINGIATGSTGTNDFISGITLGAGLDGINYNFGEQLPAGTTFVSGVVFLDANSDGTQNNGETGLPGIQVQLLSGATVVATTTTGANGSYLFTGVVPATYAVVETQPLSYGSSTPNAVVINPTFGGLTQNFGDTLGSLAGTVFTDANNDGTQDVGETGIANITLVLTGTDADGNAVSRTTTTTVTGTYVFASLPAGTYQLFETQPPTALDGIDTPGTSGGTNPVDDTIVGINLAAAVNATGYNFAERNVAPASLSGAAYVDVNANGLRDAGEPGLANIVITLKDNLGAVVATALTAANGTFSFTGLPALNGYAIEETQPAGFLDGTDIVGNVAGATRGTQSGQGATDIISAINLLAGNNAVGYLFGELNQQGTGNISGVVFRDTDANGTQAATEPGQKAVTIELLNAGNAVVATTLTSATGSFLFPNLAPGTYTVRYLNSAVPTGFGTSTVTTSTVVVAAGLTTPVTFGLTTSSLTGFVYNDINVNGIKDAGEPGIPGVIVTLTDNVGNPVVDADGNPVAALQSASDGSYRFGNLLAGTYRLRETQPANIFDGPDTIGTVGGVPIGTVTNDLFAAIALLGGQAGINYNFGDLPPTDPNGFVFRDRNGNGIFEPALGDFGINGVTIRVTGFVRDPNDFTSAIPFDETFVTGSDPNLPAGFYVFNPIPVTFPGIPDTISGSNLPGYTITEITALAQSPGLTGLQRGRLQNGAPPALSVLPATRQFANLVLNPGAIASDFNFAELAPSSISGIVYVDTNRDGRKQPKERLLANALVRLTGTDALGNLVNVTATTNAAGAYTIAGLLPPSAAGYTLAVTPPPNSGMILGRVRFPVITGAAQQPIAGTGRITRILVLDGSTLVGFNFGLNLPSKRNLTR